jgi:hypothetical protein
MYPATALSEDGDLRYGFHRFSPKKQMADETLRDTLRQWVALDDEARTHAARMKAIRDEKAKMSSTILAFMRENEMDDFMISGPSESKISRQTRIIKPAVKRNVIRTQLLLHFGDNPQRVAEALRAIEGIPEGQDAASVGVQKEILSRRIPKQRTAAAVDL